MRRLQQDVLTGSPNGVSEQGHRTGTSTGRKNRSSPNDQNFHTTFSGAATVVNFHGSKKNTQKNTLMEQGQKRTSKRTPPENGVKKEPPKRTPPGNGVKKTHLILHHILPSAKMDTGIFRTPARRSPLHSVSLQQQRPPATIARSPEDNLTPVGKMTDNAREIKNETLANYFDHHFYLTTSSTEKMTPGQNKLRRGELSAQKQGPCPAINRCWTGRTVGFAVNQVKLRRFQARICQIYYFFTG